MKARQVVSDTPNAEVEELRRTLNTLLLVLQNVSAHVAAGDIDEEEAFIVLANTLTSGVDTDMLDIGGNGNDYEGTGREVVGLKPTPQRPRMPQIKALVTMDKGSDF